MNKRNKNEIMKNFTNNNTNNNNHIHISNIKSENNIKLSIKNVLIYFPYRPYETQKNIMEKIIETLQNKNSALIESPKNSGKTLSILCSTLAYLQQERSKNNLASFAIIYSVKNIAQITNVIQELKKTCYLPVNSILMHKKNMCIDDIVNKDSENYLNLKCQYNKTNERNKCKYYISKTNINNTNSISAYDNFSIEDIKKSAKNSKFCPYFFERDKSINKSDIIFTTHEYMFKNVLKNKKFDNKMKNSILIIDDIENII